MLRWQDILQLTFHYSKLFMPCILILHTCLTMDTTLLIEVVYTPVHILIRLLLLLQSNTTNGWNNLILTRLDLTHREC